MDFTRGIPGIRPLLTYDSANWVHRTMMLPRSLTDWYTLWKQLREPLFPGHQEKLVDIIENPYIPNMIPDPLFHRAEAADQLEAEFYRNQSLRFQMRRLFMAWSAKKMARRIIGNEDVGTMDVIPEAAKVRVYDWTSRSIYQFHCSSIHHNIMAALKYNTLAISSPKIPKNPYTNLPWTIGQLLVLYDQLHERLWNQKKEFLDGAVQAFYQARFCMERFREKYGYSLDAECSRIFFHDPTSEYWDILYKETLNELLHMIQPIVVSSSLKTLVIDQSLPKHIQAVWNDILWGFWCFENLGRIVLPTVCSIYDLLDRTKEVIQMSLIVIERRKVAKKKIAAQS